MRTGFLYSIGILLLCIAVPSLAEPRLNAAQQRAVDEFVLYNGAGKAAPPLAEDRLHGTWPYGVILALSEEGILSRGSVSHVAEGVVLTAYHNLNLPGATRFLFVFYDKNGTRRVSEMETMPEYDPVRDIAVLTIPKADGEAWHVAPVTVRAFGDDVRSAPGERVEIWTADPIAVRPDVFQPLGVGPLGSSMVLGRRAAVGSPAAPTNRRFSPLPIFNGGGGYYLDGVTPRRYLTFGNSGSLITIPGDGGSEAVAVLSNIQPKDDHVEEEIVGPSGLKRLSTPGHRWSMGRLIEPILNRRTALAGGETDCALLFEQLIGRR